jgi:hypothetical protein
MAKSDKQNIFNTSMNKVGQSEREYTNQINKSEGRGDVTWNRGTEDYAGAFGGYSNYAGGGGLTDADKERMRAAYAAIGTAGGGAGGGGFSAPRLGQSNLKNLSSAYGSAYRPDYGESDTGFRRLSGAGGGFDESQLQQIYGNIGELSNIGKTGGITDEDRANINRASILEQEQTGGYSAQDKALIRAKSAASSPAYFGALKDNLERQRGATGNLAGAGAVDFKLARQAAQQQAADRTQQEIGLGESVRAGRESAGQFLSNQGMGLAGLRTANQLAGARSAGDLGLSTQQGITANQLQGLQGLQQSQTGLGQWGLGQAAGLDQFGLSQASGLDQWDLAQAQMDMAASAASAGSGAANARASARDMADYERWVTEYGNQQKQYGIGGLESLYNTNLGASQNYSGMSLDALNSKYGTQGNLLGLASQNRGNTAMENIGTIGGIVAPIAGAWLGAGGGGGGSPRPTGGGGQMPVGQAGANSAFGGVNYGQPYTFGQRQQFPPQQLMFGGGR